MLVGFIEYDALDYAAANRIRESFRGELDLAIRKIVCDKCKKTKNAALAALLDAIKTTRGALAVTEIIRRIMEMNKHMNTPYSDGSNKTPCDTLREMVKTGEEL